MHRAGRGSGPGERAGVRPGERAGVRPGNPAEPPGVAPCVIVDLYSSSFCAACSATRTVLERAAALVPAVDLVERNVATSPDEAEAAGVRSTPTVIVRDSAGDELFRAEGVPTLDQVLVALARAL